jgi:hypothetical protein
MESGWREDESAAAVLFYLRSFCSRCLPSSRASYLPPELPPTPAFFFPPSMRMQTVWAGRLNLPAYLPASLSRPISTIRHPPSVSNVSYSFSLSPCYNTDQRRPRDEQVGVDAPAAGWPLQTSCHRQSALLRRTPVLVSVMRCPRCRRLMSCSVDF